VLRGKCHDKGRCCELCQRNKQEYLLLYMGHSCRCPVKKLAG
jgi:hypothetical protein